MHETPSTFLPLADVDLNYQSGIGIGDTFDMWRKKTNGLISDFNPMVDNDHIVVGTITSDRLAAPAPTWDANGNVSTNGTSGDFTAKGSITGKTININSLTSNSNTISDITITSSANNKLRLNADSHSVYLNGLVSTNDSSIIFGSALNDAKSLVIGKWSAGTGIVIRGSGTTSAGRIGINRIPTAYALEVAGSIHAVTGTVLADSLSMSSTSATSTIAGPLQAKTLTTVSGTLGNNVGNTLSLSSLKGSNTNVTSLETYLLRDITDATPDWMTSSIISGIQVDDSPMAYVRYNGAANNNGISFGTTTGAYGGNNVVRTDRLTINSSGLVGIGTAPLTGNILALNGNINVSGTYTQNGKTKPTGWGGGVTTFDVYSDGGTIGIGEAGTLLATMNKLGAITGTSVTSGGNIRGSTLQTDSKLTFTAGTGFGSTDLVTIERVNPESDVSQLRFTIGDNGDVYDSMLIGTAQNTWTEKIRFNSNGSAVFTGSVTTVGFVNTGLATSSTFRAATAATVHTKGAHLEWNKTITGIPAGSTFLLNQKGLGGGGIIFGEVSAADVVTETARINPTGGLTTVGNINAKAYSASWGTTNSNSTGAINAVMGTNGVNGASWLLSGTSAGTFRGGIQLLETGNITRIYTNTSYLELEKPSSGTASKLTAGIINGGAITGTSLSAGTGSIGGGLLDIWKNNQSSWSAAGIISNATTGDAAISLHASGATAAYIRHPRSGNGIEIYDASTALANVKAAGINVARSTASDGIPVNGGINLNASGNGYIYGTNQDGASNTLANVKITSWHGVGFGPSIADQTIPQGQNAVFIDVRAGNLTARGTVTAAAPISSKHLTTKAYVDSADDLKAPIVSPAFTGTVTIHETTGTAATATTGTLVLTHGNSGGASSIVFPSKTNRASDYAFIQYQDDETVGGAGEKSKLIIGIENDGLPSNRDDIILKTTGGVGINNNTPTVALDVTGDIRASANIIAYATSDRKFKDNIKNITNPLDKVSQINGVAFDWNDKQTTFVGHDIGVIAQEVEAVLPEIVTTRQDGSKAVKYDKMVALLIECVKELKSEIEELKLSIK